MKHFGIVMGLAIVACLVCFTPISTFAQATSVAIKVEAMSPHRLEEIGQPDPGDHSYISSGLKVVGVGSYVWLSGWDISAGTGYNPGTAYSWTFNSRPASSTAAFDNANGSLVKFQADKAGDYAIQLTLDGKDTTVTIKAATYSGVDRSSVSGAGFNCKTCHQFGTPQVYSDWAASGHATMFQNGMNGVLGSYWGASCFPCHTTGYNTNALAVNGGFDDVATANGFDLADSSAAGQWKPLRATNYDSLKGLTNGEQLVTLVAGITCENCHGPYRGGGGGGHQDKSMDPGVCAQCHNEPWRHNRYVQYEFSGHSESVWSSSFQGSSVITAPDGYTLSACVRCHDGQAFVNFTKGENFDRRAASGYNPLTHTKITCQTCHEPHSTGFRTTPTATDTLGNGFAYAAADFGKGMICASCHKYRRDAVSYVATASMSSHWGPHYVGAADTWLGQNGFEYGQSLTRKSAHQLMITESCVQCHMSATPDTGTAARDKLGMHTWNMEYLDTTSGTTYDNVTGCVGCHGPITSFSDIKGIDYDMDGTIESTMHEVEGLLEKVAMALPPVGSPDIDYAQIDANPADSAKFRAAYWNWLYVDHSGDKGAHNPKYTIGLLQTTLNQLTGVEFVNSEIPMEFELAQNYPNPFNPTTEITFALPKAGLVVLEVYDLTGRVVSTLVNQDLPAGTHKVVWNARSSSGQALSSGVYLYRIATGEFVATKKMVLLK